jgi:hypothetical protein
VIANILLALGVLLYFGRRYSAEWKPGQVYGFYQSGAFRSLIMLAVPLWTVDILSILSNQTDQLSFEINLATRRWPNTQPFYFYRADGSADDHSFHGCF